MDDLSFIYDDTSDLSHATLKVVLPSGQVYHISDNVNPYRLIDHCPLLFHAFEVGHRGRLQATIDAPSRSAVIALFRYCYTGNHLNSSVNNKDIELLLHVHLYKMAVDFDLPELQLLAHGSFACHIETAACLQDPPVDLLDTIRFVYQYFSDEQSRFQHGLVATLRNYCISTYIYHNLGHSSEFLALVSDMPAFGRDLCRTNIERDFEDDCAGAIIRLPPGHVGGPSNVTGNTLASRDLPDEMLCDAPPEPPKFFKIDRVNETSEGPERDHNGSGNMVTSTATLAHRPRTPRPQINTFLDQDLSSDEDGFTLVHRPYQPYLGAKDESLFSPEPVLSNPFNVLAATGSDYPSDDEWSML
ncbi:hypothetical protein J1614_006010 [Plenodomus biglobosus]|nr:hypothetical protein J1614_006010 [Plenodomus biglobosus]